MSLLLFKFNLWLVPIIIAIIFHAIGVIVSILAIVKGKDLNRPNLDMAAVITVLSFMVCLFAWFFHIPLSSIALGFYSSTSICICSFAVSVLAFIGLLIATFIIAVEESYISSLICHSIFLLVALVAYACTAIFTKEKVNEDKDEGIALIHQTLTQPTHKV